MKDDASLPMLLDVHLLQLFELLYTTRSVTRASEQLGLAQPTVSIWLGKLRQRLNDPLFVRTPSGMQPTPGAEGIDARTEHRLETGDADLALGVLPDIAPGLYQQSLFTQDWACLANARHPRIAEDLPLAAIGGLQVFPCPFPIPSFTVRQHWHARFHHDAGNRWLRGVCAGLFLRSGQAVA